MNYDDCEADLKLIENKENIKSFKLLSKEEREKNITERKKNEEIMKIKKFEENKSHLENFLKHKTKNKVTEAPVVSEEISKFKSNFLNQNKTEKRRHKGELIFDWDPNDDTSKEILFEPKLSFGKGKIAGVDDEYLEYNKNYYNKLLDERDKQYGFEFIPPLQKKREEIINVEEKQIEKMTDRDWKIFRENYNIKIKSQDCELPIRSWEEAGLLKKLKDNILKLYKKPTAIQMQTIPVVLSRKDMIGISPTGSGKSAAFLIPLIHFILLQEKQQRVNLLGSDGPSCLIISPTRDLAIQIEEEFIKLTNNMNLRSACLIGGKSIDEQFSSLSSGVDLVVGAPGRIKDLINRSYLELENCQFVVIDEADKIIKDGFEEDVKFILEQIKNKTTLMFSATMSGFVEKMTKSYLKEDRIYIEILKEEEELIDQRFEVCVNQNIKYNQLKVALESNRPPIMVFTNKRETTLDILKFIEKLGFSAIDVHGEKAQDYRESVLKSFKEGKYDVLISTSLLGRGIDVKGVSLVINFDCPSSIEDYEHRIGRTGRAGKTGVSLTFLNEKNSAFAQVLAKEFEKKGKKVPKELLNSSNENVIYTN